MTDTDTPITADVEPLLQLTKAQLAKIVAQVAFVHGDIYIPSVNSALEARPLVVTVDSGTIHAAEYAREEGWYLVYDARTAREGAAWWDGEFWVVRPRKAEDDFVGRFGDRETITVIERLVQQ